MADVKLSQLAVVSPASAAAGAALWTLPGHIDGLSLEWLAANQLRVTSGSAYIQSLGYAVNVAAAITKTGLTLTASTWYHVYLYMNGAMPDIEIVTTAPAAPYFGTARTKTGDASRRYLGSVRTTAAANTMAQFQHNSVDNSVTYAGAPYPMRNLLLAGTATVATTVSAANIIPETAVSIDILMTNTGTPAAVTGIPGQSNPLGAGAASSYFGYADNGGVGVPNHPVVSQTFQYRFLSAPTGSLYIDLNAYKFGR